ncbi:Neutral/alkaline nonlysosomal ceramidase, partial [Podospora conica]
MLSQSRSHGRGPGGFTSLFLTLITLLAFIQLGSASPFQPLHDRQATGDKYLIGVGKGDITGPVVEINFAGYASTDQVGTGLRQRIFSRAFIVGEVGNPRARFVYLVLDTQSGDTALRNGILEGVAALGPAYAMYGRSNIAVTGTHSHSGPGAWFNYLLPQITSLGFDKQSYQAVVDGAVLSIKRAHESLQEGFLDFGTTTVPDANLNRSPWAYLANPAEERAKYADDVDKALTLLRFKRASDGKSIGVLTWFAVHGTSMLGNNTHVSGDNKGVAAILFEKSVKGDPQAAEGFVAGFSQSTVGDTTPNVLGAYCDDGSGQQCSFESSTCADGKSQACHGRGPAFQKLDLGVSSCFEIGRRQFAGAKALFDTPASLIPIVGATVSSVHNYNDMSYHTFPLPNGTLAQTCPAALGYSFAAGTSDGPGAFDFTQGDSGAPSANPIWGLISSLLRAPSPAQAACQQPKPILLDVGELSAPYAWSPNIVDVQTLRVGQLLMIISPSEASTMAGRRWRTAVGNAAAAGGVTPQGVTPIVVLAGPANTYAHYVVTPEEYDRQRYEGASTLYGKWTLPGYINLTLTSLPFLRPGATGGPAAGPIPPDNRARSLSFISKVLFDSAPAGKKFGQCTASPAGEYARGAVVRATFIGANPRNDLRLGGTFAAVERRRDDGVWERVRDDEDWNLVYEWKRTNVVLGWSEVTIQWETEGEERGRYRIRYYGDAKGVIGGVKGFEGVSGEFLL